MANTRRRSASPLPPSVAVIQPLVREESRVPFHPEENDSTSPIKVQLEARLAKFYLEDTFLRRHVQQSYLKNEQNYTVKLSKMSMRGRPRKNPRENTFKVTFGLDFVDRNQHDDKNILFANWIRENNSQDLFTVLPLADCFTESSFSRTDQTWSSLWNTSQSVGDGSGTTELSFVFHFTSKDFKLLTNDIEPSFTPLRLAFECYKFNSVTHDWTERIDRKCCVIKVFEKDGAQRRHFMEDFYTLTAAEHSGSNRYVPLPESVPKNVAKFWSFPDDVRNGEEGDQSETEEDEQMEVRDPIRANVVDDDDQTEEEDQVVPQNGNEHVREEEQQEVPMEIQQQNDENYVFDNEQNDGIEDNDGANYDWLNTSTSLESQTYQEVPEPNVPLPTVNLPVQFPPSTSTFNPPLNNQQQQQVESPNRFPESSPAYNEFDQSAIQPRTCVDQMSTVQPSTSNQNQNINQTTSNNQQQQQSVRNVVVNEEPREERTVPQPPNVDQVQQQPNDQVKVIYLTIPETLRAYPVYLRAQDDFLVAVQEALAPVHGNFIAQDVRLVGQMDDGQIDTLSVNPRVLNSIENESILDVQVSPEGVVFMAFKTDIEQLINAQQNQ